jgi:hypothetical protein
MKTLKWLAIAMFLVISLTAATARAQAIPVVSDVAAQERAAWKVACWWKQFDCTTIPAPVVVYKALGDNWGLYEHGAKVVIVDEGIRGQDFAALTMIHEFVHYIQWHQGYHRFSKEARGSCAREKEAFQAANEVARGFDVTDIRLNTWEEMAASYGCQL